MVSDSTFQWDVEYFSSFLLISLSITTSKFINIITKQLQNFLCKCWGIFLQTDYLYNGFFKFYCNENGKIIINCLFNFLYIHLPKSNVARFCQMPTSISFLIYFYLLLSSFLLPIANSFSVRHWTSWPLLFPMLRFLCWACAWCRKLCECICANALLCQENMVFLLASSRF